jgi:hypothetical protein
MLYFFEKRPVFLILSKKTAEMVAIRVGLIMKISMAF